MHVCVLHVYMCVYMYICVCVCDGYEDAMVRYGIYDGYEKSRAAYNSSVCVCVYIYIYACIYIHIWRLREQEGQICLKTFARRNPTGSVYELFKVRVWPRCDRKINNEA